MRQNIKHKREIVLGVCCIVLMTFFACQETDLEAFTPLEPNLNFGVSQLEITADAGTYQIPVTSNLPWRAKSEASWITLEVENGAGDGDIVINVEKNTNENSRSGRLVVWITQEQPKEFLVTQSEGEAQPSIFQVFYVKGDGNANASGTSWSNATTLAAALSKALSGDTLHIAAGVYAPERTITGGDANNARDKTHEIANNIVLIGGYPANASEGAVSSPDVNTTVLSGSMGSANAYHAVTVTAPLENGRKVILNGLTIKDGETGVAGTGEVSANGVRFMRTHGGGLVIGKSVVDVINCDITDNVSQTHAAGVFVFAGATVMFDKCKLRNNIGNASCNGGGLWNDASVVYLYNTEVSNNQIVGVGAGIYAFGTGSAATKTYIINSTISENKTGASNSASGYYGRAGSTGVIINSTISGNVTSGDGGGISMHGGAVLDVISSTITGNSSARNGGGIMVHIDCTLSLYNTIVSGNTGLTEDVNEIRNDGTCTQSYSIIGKSLYDESNLVEGKTFNAATMLGALANNGGFTKTCTLTGDNNVAVGNGMSLTALEVLNLGYAPNVPETAVSVDQTGRSRAGKTDIGAVIKN